jgi:hypothetical protein
MSTIKNTLKRVPALRRLSRSLNNQHERDDFVVAELAKIQAGKLLLDAGCPSSTDIPVSR